MSSDSKVYARHAGDDDDGFENLPTVDEKKQEEEVEELKEPKVYDGKGKPPLATVVWVNWAAVIVLGIAVAAVCDIRSLQTTPVAAVSEIPFRYHRIEMTCMAVMTAVIVAIALASVSLAEINHHVAMETLHAHRLETYRLHKELLRAKKYKKD